MKTINFTDLELESMIEMYTAEMEDAKLYIAQIQELLKKLGAKPTKEKVTEKEPKQGKKRGPKPSVKVVEKSEPKKRGRKKSVPAIEPVVVTPTKVVKKAEPKKKVSAKIEEKSVVKPAPVKKATVLKPTTKSVPVAATKTNTKKQVELNPEPVVEVKKEVKKVEPLKKIAAKAKVIAEQKPVVKPTPKKKPEAKVAAKVESVVTSLLTKEPKKEVKKVVKNKSTEKKRMDEMATSSKLTKPVSKKAPKVNVVTENPPIEPTVAPTEQS